MTPWELLGEPSAGGVLIVADHASNHVPTDIDLGIDPALLNNHIAIDIGVASTARQLVENHGFAAFLAFQSRLVVDCNRASDDPAAIPASSDGIFIPGNQLTDGERAARLARFHSPYHERLEQLLAEYRPGLILSLHSFTPSLSSRPDEQRPWQIGVLYNHYEAASKAMIAALDSAGLNVGDQLPYSGKQLNYTMDRHAESAGIPYVGIEIRQDQVTTETGCAKFAQIIGNAAQGVAAGLASGAIALP